jgi:hypothetical protein
MDTIKKKVTDEQLLVDIANTKDEITAYEHLMKGYLILSNLPETDLLHSRAFVFESKKHETSWRGCKVFLEKLLTIKTTRGL